jgi:single-strand DNA-binding protein
MYHTLIIAGNVGGDPSMRYTPSGQAVTSFSVASTRQYTKDGAQVKETIWFRVSTWGKDAENCNQYLRKGSKVLIEGRLTPDKETGGPRVWTGKNDQPSASFEVTANTVRFLSGKSDGESMTQTAQGFGGVVAPSEEDIPF